MSMPISCASIASSFTYAMFTARYVFSASFAISATFGEATTVTSAGSSEHRVEQDPRHLASTLA